MKIKVFHESMYTIDISYNSNDIEFHYHYA